MTRKLTVLVMLMSAVDFSRPQTPHAASPGAAALIMERDQGEVRVRRRPVGNGNVPMSIPASEFILKISPKNNGSQRLVLGTEVIPPGGRIRPHHHLEQDEILIIQTGVAHVRLGDREADVHAGGTVFIPANTIIGLQNTGTEPINLVFVFSAPGFEDYMRCTSVPAGQNAPPITLDELRRCSREGHVMYEDLETGAERR